MYTLRENSKMEQSNIKMGNLKVAVQSTVYPFGYNKNAATDKNNKTFTKNFNRWAMYIRESTLPNEAMMNKVLNQAKELITA